MDNALKRLLELAASGDEEALDRLAGVLRRRGRGEPRDDWERACELVSLERWEPLSELMRTSQPARLAFAGWLRRRLEGWRRRGNVAVITAWGPERWEVRFPENWRATFRETDGQYWTERVVAPDDTVLHQTARATLFLLTPSSIYHTDTLTAWIGFDDEREETTARQLVDGIRAAGRFVEDLSRARTPSDAISSAGALIERLGRIGGSGRGGSGSS